MLWLDSLTRAGTLPAVWLIATGDAPRTRPERSALRARVSQSVLAMQVAGARAAIGIGHEPSGRPILSGCPGLCLSHATRGGLVAVALSRGPVGVDVEQVGEGPIPLNALHRAEQIWLNQLPEGEREAAFAMLWAVKEAYGKWAGTGLADTDRDAALPAADGIWRLTGPMAQTPAPTILTRGVERDGAAFALAVVF